MSKSRSKKDPYGTALLIFVGVFVASSVSLFLLADLPPGISYLIVINFTTMIVWTWDKIRAMRKEGRVPEILLITAVIIGGSAGGLLGMILIRHKIRKVRFQVICIVSFILHGLIVGWLIFGGSILSASSSP